MYTYIHICVNVNIRIYSNIYIHVYTCKYLYASTELGKTRIKIQFCFRKK